MYLFVGKAKAYHGASEAGGIAIPEARQSTGHHTERMGKHDRGPH